MATKRFSLLLCVALALPACTEPRSEAPAVDDQSWDDLTSEQRRAHLLRKLDENLDVLRTTEDAQTWHAAASEATRALSLFRVEGGLLDTDAYAELEAEVEQLTDTPPVSADPR